MSKVFGIGLPKTGTASLAKALSALGLPTLHNPKDYWDRLHMGAGLPGGWEALVHFGFRQYRWLDRAYPGSKFILTTRDKAAWLDSCERQFRHEFIYSREQEAIRLDVFGMTDFDRGHFSDIYDAHCWAVVNWFHSLPADRWLAWDLCANPGWGPLCDLLDLPIPDQPFPHAHDFEGALKTL